VHNGTVTELTHPRFGSYRAVQNPLRLSRTPVEARGYAADLGEHSRQILQEMGYGAAAVEDLLRSGVVIEPVRAGALCAIRSGRDTVTPSMSLQS
jgi:crotonobetainyl-CoA:carnitine CoA-transferase CaiB-like acyl-CoA transferase